jgi:hypothetical protein
MKTVAVRRVFALCSYVAFLAAGPAAAQIGPIQPVLVLEDGKAEHSHSRPNLPDDYSVPIDVYVAPDGTVSNVVVSDSTGNLDADRIAATYMRDQKFLPGLDMKGQPVPSTVRVTVNMFKRGTHKVVKVTLKPPPIAAETDRVRKLMCADFLWEMERIRKGAGIRDASYEVMPYVSARAYMTSKDVSDEVEAKFWDMWPDALEKIVNRCEKDELKLFFSEVLVPTLDGVLPTKDTAVAIR